MDNTIETITISPTLRARIVIDDDVEAPENDLFKITYRASSRYVLGTEAVDASRRDEIADGLADGSLIGWNVFAYVHSGATIHMADSNPFHCRWDSGQSGVVYARREDVLLNFGNKRLTKKVLEQARAYADSVVRECASYLEGDVYGYILERTRVNADEDVMVEETLDSCWSIYGLDSARELAADAAKHCQ